MHVIFFVCEHVSAQWPNFLVGEQGFESCRAQIWLEGPLGKTYSGAAAIRIKNALLLSDYLLFMKTIIHNLSMNLLNVIKRKLLMKWINKKISVFIAAYPIKLKSVLEKQNSAMIKNHYRSVSWIYFICDLIFFRMEEKLVLISFCYCIGPQGMLSDGHDA